MSSASTTVCLNLSLQHLTWETRHMLDSKLATEWPLLGGHYEYGYFIYGDEDALTEESDIPEDLRACIRYAREQGFEWLRFDVDETPYTDLPVLSGDECDD